MLILLDNNAPRGLARALTGHVVTEAREYNSYGAAPEDHDVTLRISVTDKTVTRTCHGKRMKLLGKNVDLSSEWLEETLK